MIRDVKASIFLPRTDFPMRGNLPVREPEMAERWRKIDLFALLRQDAAGRPKFVLHDGPPYANGHLHIGHALNKILKDVIARSYQMLGRDSIYVPGWDCHGLPIEWKIEEEYRARGQDKNSVPVLEFRRQCRAFAERWLDIQRSEFRRLGVIGDWENPYKTMDFAAEAQIFREFAKFLMNGGVYQGARPVLWSVVERTALADAEVEYHDHVSTSIYVRFPIVHAGPALLAGAGAAIWTTTPWTLPGNRAIAYRPDLTYAVIEVSQLAEGSLAGIGDRLVIAQRLVDEVASRAKIARYRVLGHVPGTALAGGRCRHPLASQGYDFTAPLLAGEHVTDDQGTGLVHTAPGHGIEDFELARRFDLEIPRTVDDDGLYYPDVPLFAGIHVFKAAEPICAALQKEKALLAESRLTHSYPHSWRSKAPLIYRATPQWFISMDVNDLRAKALKAIAETRWVPAQGQARIQEMIEQRPDWCISRQRSWGVPLAIFVNRATGEPLRDDAVNARIAEAFESEGGDAWFSAPPERFLGHAYDAAQWQQIRDVIEVWFDSGSTHAFVLEKRPDLIWPASLYLEGSDQHRGWFHSSLLESCGTRGRAPYDAVLTHGFVLDEKGRKMSKSLGNIVAPQEVADSMGVDILRLWVVGSNYSEDLHIGPGILKYQADLYRRLRNTLRYLLGALDGFTPAERLNPADMPELERWILHRLTELDKLIRHCIDAFDFHTAYSKLHHFCAVDLSAFYFDIRKDSLYCDAPWSMRRRACRSAFEKVFDCLVVWLAPVLCFTAEEAWSLRPGAGGEITDSVHRQLFPTLPADWRDDDLAERWALIRDVRSVVTGAIELARGAKEIGASLQAAPAVYLEERYRAALADQDLAEIAITSAVALLPLSAAPDEGLFTQADIPGVAVAFAKAEGERCERCWKIVAKANHRTGVALCPRCQEVAEGT